MDDEKLLECVRKYPVIYDMSHPKYLDNKYKNIIWKTISDEIKQSDDVCKKRWANIRDQFKKHRNKRKTKSGQGAVAIKKYKYEESLNFLLPHIQDRNTITSIESENEETQNETVTSLVTTPDETINTDKQQQQEDRSPAINEPNFTPPNPNTNPQSTAQFTGSGKRNRNQTIAPAYNRRRIVPQSQSSASSALMEYILKNKEKSNTHDIHPIDAFFNGLAPTIKSFSPYYQHLAKGRIFAVVQDLEWEQLSTEPSSYTSPMSGTMSASSTNSTPVYAQVPMTTPTPTPESTPAEPTPSELTPLEPNNLSTLFSEFTAGECNE